jgi:hypothetical protein
MVKGIESVYQEHSGLPIEPTEYEVKTAHFFTPFVSTKNAFCLMRLHACLLVM